MRNAFSGWAERAAVAVILAAGAQGAGAQPEALLRPIAPLDNDEPVGFYVSGSEPGVRPRGLTPGSDPELCAWALDDWIRHSEGRLSAEPADEDEALIRVYFVEPAAGQYGEMRAILVGSRRGAEVYVRNDTASLGPEIAEAASADPLFRDTIVYLTCLHEIGHALGMVHTDRFADVMYFFGFGGDIRQFFGRYRERLGARDDIAQVSGLSEGDIGQLLSAYPLSASSSR